MDSAAVGAELLADTAHGAWSRGDDDWADEYERRRDTALLETFHETVSLARDLSRLSDAD